MVAPKMLQADDCKVGEDDGPSEGDDEFLDIGAKRRVVDLLRTRRGRWLGLLAAGLIAAGAFAVVSAGGKSSGGPSHAASAPATSISAPYTPPTPAPSTGPPVEVIRVGPPLLGIHAGWELFGRGDGTVVRIEFARGRVTTTTVPTLASTGPVSFIAVAGAALIRPIDLVPGYLIPDGRPARPLSGVLGQGGPVFPGPDPNHVWVQAGDTSNRMTLVGLDGRSAGMSLRVPGGMSSLSALPDQTGYLAFLGDAGVFDVRPGRTSRITTGTLLAIGPTRWLVSECHTHAHCATVLVNRSSGARRDLPIHVGEAAQPGVISPDGTLAAVLVKSPMNQLEILNLTADTVLPLPFGIDLSKVNPQQMIWSPDSRWLFTIDSDDDLYAINAKTGGITDLSVESLDYPGFVLPPLSQLAIRTTAGKSMPETADQPVRWFDLRGAGHLLG